MIEELERPSAVEDAEQAIEVLRAWVADEHLQASLDPLAFENAEVWGSLLADLARHVANHWSEATGENPVEVFSDIVGAFIAEAEETSAVQSGSPERDSKG